MLTYMLDVMLHISGNLSSTSIKWDLCLKTGLCTGTTEIWLMEHVLSLVLWTDLKVFRLHQLSTALFIWEFMLFLGMHAIISISIALLIKYPWLLFHSYSKWTQLASIVKYFHRVPIIIVLESWHSNCWVPSVYDISHHQEWPREKIHLCGTQQWQCPSHQHTFYKFHKWIVFGPLVEK